MIGSFISHTASLKSSAAGEWVSLLLWSEDFIIKGPEGRSHPRE
jgi:hypothetical protein